MNNTNDEPHIIETDETVATTGHLLSISDEMFEKLIARAKAFGEEMWRRQLFDHPGMLESMLKHSSPEAVEYIRNCVVDAIAEEYCERVARHANE
jgi:hypothetical protein